MAINLEMQTLQGAKKNTGTETGKMGCNSSYQYEE